MPEHPKRSRTDRWSDLITEGHVRAARLRRMQPTLYLGGVVAIIAGFYMAVAIPGPSNVAAQSPAQDQVARSRQPVTDALAGLPPLAISAAEYPQLAPADQLPKVAQTLLDSLNKSGKLPDMPLDEKTAQDFWTKPWPLTDLPTVGNDQVRLVGAIANDGNAYYARPIRWLIVYSRRKDHWEMASASDQPFTPKTTPAVSLENIPLTLRSVLPVAH